MPKSHNFLMPLKIEFWWILGGKMEASWHPNRIQNRSQLRKADFAKSVEKQTKKTLFFKVLGVEVGSQIRLKIGQKLKSKLECLLASIFDGFWWTLGGKLGRKIGPRAIKNGTEKRMKKWEAIFEKRPPKVYQNLTKRERKAYLINFRYVFRCGANSAD